MAADAPRKSYRRGRLEPSDLDPDPLRQLEAWLRDALASGLPEPNAMTLATADASGRVSARMVLLKGIVDGGLEFYTNYASRKARDLEANPQAAACFWWDRLERQVRLEGGVTRLPEAASRAYFASRPYGSQLAAWASEQSRTVASREALEERFAEMRARFPEGEVPLPPAWGGYRLMPERIEFWQGRENRLHDRLLYRPIEGGWKVERLFP
ncbi:MAG: pyridoxamine 5'-phosphate oxidase [Deinococcales bacterium]